MNDMLDANAGADRGADEASTARFDGLLLLEACAEAALVLDAAGEILFCNSAAARLAGGRVAVGQTLGSLSAELPEGLVEACREVRASGTALRRDMPHSASSGWFEVRILPLAGEDRLVVLLHEVTERRRAEASQQLAQEQILAILEAIGDAFYTVDGEWRLTYVNRRIEQLWGRPREALIGQRLGDVLTDYVGTPAHEQLATAMRRRRAATFEAISHVTGRWIEISCYPHRDGLLVYSHNIAARKRAEESLRESEDRLRLAVAATGLGTFDFDVASGRRDWSPAYKAMLGLPPEAEATYDAFLAALHPADRAFVEQTYARAFDPASGGEFAAEFRTVTGRWISARGRVSFDEQRRPVRSVGTMLDITERKRAEVELRHLTETLEQRVAERTRQLTFEMHQREQAEEQLRQAQKIEAVGQLTGGVAHDFNNLLTAVLGNLDLLSSEVTSGRGRKLLAAAVRAGERGATLTRQLLAFARRQHLMPQPTDLNRLVGGMRDMLARTLGGTIRIVSDLAPDLWPSLVDANQIELILLNLAINARDAMPGGGTLRIATDNLVVAAGEIEDLAAGDYVRITVRDTGIGMEEEVLNRAVEPFFTTKKAGAGTGLGLSQAFGVARQLGGTVRLHSVPRRGTTVEVLLPRSLQPAVVEPGSESSAARTETGGLTILVVDDDPEVREVIATALRGFGHEVHEASDGPAGLEALAAIEALDLMIVDYAMPGMTGAELVRQARGLRPALPALYVTGYAEHLPPLGPRDSLLDKPFRGADMAGRIAEFLAKVAELAE